MGIIAFIVLGLIAGVIAKAIMPGDDPGGFIITAIIGIVGALLGGFIAAAVFDADPLDEFFDISTWLTAIVGAIVLLVIYRLVWIAAVTAGLRALDPCQRSDAPTGISGASDQVAVASIRDGDTRGGSCSGSAREVPRTSTHSGRQARRNSKHSPLPHDCLPCRVLHQARPPHPAAPPELI